MYETEKLPWTLIQILQCSSDDVIKNDSDIKASFPIAFQGFLKLLVDTKSMEVTNLQYKQTGGHEKTAVL